MATTMMIHCFSLFVAAARFHGEAASWRGRDLWACKTFGWCYSQLSLKTFWHYDMVSFSFRYLSVYVECPLLFQNLCRVAVYGASFVLINHYGFSLFPCIVILGSLLWLFVFVMGERHCHRTRRIITCTLHPSFTMTFDFVMLYLQKSCVCFPPS